MTSWSFIPVGLLLGAVAPTPLPAEPQETPVVRAVRVSEQIAVDGRLDEESWRLAEPATGFRQREPDEGAPATERTDVRVLYDDRYLYIGIWAFDRNPPGIVARKLERDATVNDDDSVQIVLDTFHDHRNAFFFATNPRGAREDGLITDEQFRINRDWDGVWEVESRQTADGWVVELAIPWWTLRFREVPEQTWGFNVQRIIKRKTEESLWAAWTRDNGGIHRVSLAGHLEGLAGLDQGRNLQVKPFIASRVDQDGVGRTALATSGEFDAGLDVKYGLSSDLTLDLTVNTDFAQVEADVEQINITRFPLFFPEKREFFLENAGLFDFGPGPPPFGPPPLVIFQSRRIGIEEEEEEEDRREVPIIAGARVTGKLAGFDLGLLEVVTDEAGTVPRANFGVARLKRNIINSSSTVGGILTLRDPEGEGANTNFGVDTRLQLTQELRFDGFYTENREPGVETRRGAGALALDLTSDRFGFFLQHLRIGENFSPGVGFVLRQDIQRYFGAFRWSPRPGWELIRKFDIRPEIEYIEDDDHRIQDRRFEFNFNSTLESGDFFRIDGKRRFERLDEPFEIREGLEIPAADYENNGVDFGFRTSDKRAVSVNGGFTREGFFSGDRTSWRVGLRVAPSAHFSGSVNFDRNEIDLPEGAFDTNLIRLRLNYAFTTDLFTNALIQYNSDTGEILTNVRLNFIHTPGSDLFFVYNEIRGDGTVVTELARRALILKLTYLINL